MLAKQAYYIANGDISLKTILKYDIGFRLTNTLACAMIIPVF